MASKRTSSTTVVNAKVFLISSFLESRKTLATWPVKAGSNKFIIMPIEKVEKISQEPIFLPGSIIYFQRWDLTKAINNSITLNGIRYQKLIFMIIFQTSRKLKSLNKKTIRAKANTMPQNLFRFKNDKLNLRQQGCLNPSLEAVFKLDEVIILSLG